MLLIINYEELKTIIMEILEYKSKKKAPQELS